MPGVFIALETVIAETPAIFATLSSVIVDPERCLSVVDLFLFIYFDILPFFSR